MSPLLLMIKEDCYTTIQDLGKSHLQDVVVNRKNFVSHL